MLVDFVIRADFRKSCVFVHTLKAKGTLNYHVQIGTSV